MTPRKFIAQITFVAALALAAYSLGGKGCDWKWPDIPVDPQPPVVVVPAAPFKTDKLAVLIVEETKNRAALPVWVDSTLPESLRGVVKTRGGDFKLLDADQKDFANQPPWVAEAFKVPHPELPWIVAAGPQTGFSRKLPATADETLKLLEGVK